MSLVSLGPSELVLDCMNSTFVSSSVNTSIDSSRNSRTSVVSNVPLRLPMAQRRSPCLQAGRGAERRRGHHACNDLRCDGKRGLPSWRRPAFCRRASRDVGFGSGQIESLAWRYCRAGTRPLPEPKNRTTHRAIVPMHTFGHMCDMWALLEIAAEFRIPVIEDAAEALGSRLDGQHAGSFGLCGTLSFNGNKTITTGGWRGHPDRRPETG